MTAEEIDILVQANIDGAVKQFRKLLPEVKKQINRITQEFNKAKLKDITAKINMSQVKDEAKKIGKQIKEVFNPDDISGINYIGNFGKEIKGISKQFKSLTGQKVDLGNAIDLAGYRSKLEKSEKEAEETWQEISNKQAFKYDTASIQNFVNNYANATDNAKKKVSQLKQEIDQTSTSQNRLTSCFSGFKGKIEQAKTSVSSLRGHFNQMPKITQNITNNIKKMGTNIKSSLKHVLKYAAALFSIRGIYSILSQSAQSWLSSQNSGAQQLSANIEYMKYAMGSAFAPVIEHVINLVYQLMKAIQSVVYAFSGINIFAKATASSMNKTAKSAKDANKSLVGVHNEINNVQDNNSKSGEVGPSIDLSQVDTSMNGWIGKIKEKLKLLFEPIKKAWEKEGQPTINKAKNAIFELRNTIDSMASSWITVWTNGTGQQTIELILKILQKVFSIVEKIAKSWNTAWNKENRGTKLIQTIWNALNKLLELIDVLATKIEEFVSNPIVEKYFENVIEMITNLMNALRRINRIYNRCVNRRLGKSMEWIKKYSFWNI